jgi:hypothetical protein
VPGLKTGELAGVILRVAPDPGILLLVFHGVLAITSTSESLRLCRWPGQVEQRETYQYRHLLYHRSDYRQLPDNLD